LFISTAVYGEWTLDSLVEKGHSLYNTTKEKAIVIYSDKIKPTIQDISNQGNSEVVESADESREAKINKIVSKVFNHLEEGVEKISQLKKAPESTFLIGKDKNDIQKDINSILDEIIILLTGEDLDRYRENVQSLKGKISTNKHNILKYREQKIGAPETGMLETTKADYDKKIADAKVKIKIYENEIRIEKNKFKNSFQKIDVKLTSEQIDVLLTRVDGDDILQISLVMDTLKYITNQIMILMKESDEELVQAKKYYGMHLISLELVVYIQQNYINKVEKQYIPKIEKIMENSRDLKSKTESLIYKENDKRRKEIYMKNLKAQLLTYKVAKLYKNDLINSQKGMIKAKNISYKNLILSKNTYETVLLSADLYELISESQNMFEEISKIQIPDIVIFQNIQIQKKYEELTGMLKE